MRPSPGLTTGGGGNEGMRISYISFKKKKKRPKFDDIHTEKAIGGIYGSVSLKMWILLCVCVCGLCGRR